jgi:chymotrypsin
VKNFRRNVVTPHAHPYQAALLMDFPMVGTALCSGSVLSTRAILTAASCVVGSSSTQVILGAHRLTVNEATQQRQTVPESNYRIHPTYNSSNFENNLAILIMPVDSILNEFVAISDLAYQATFEGILGTVSGWGRISDSSSTVSVQLRSVQNNIIANSVCEATFGSTIIPSTICISTAGGRGPCGGDSGSPLTVDMYYGRVQVGISSFGAAAGCESGFPAGFTRVTSFLHWIENNQRP